MSLPPEAIRLGFGGPPYFILQALRGEGVFDFLRPSEAETMAKVIGTGKSPGSSKGSDRGGSPKTPNTADLPTCKASYEIEHCGRW